MRVRFFIFTVVFASLFASGYALRAQADEASSSFAFVDLMNIVKTKQVNSIDDLLPALPASYQKYFVTMLKSGSLQYASPTSPRIISYGSYRNNPVPGADQLYIAFQTDKTLRTDGPSLPNSLEVIEWKTDQKAYQFYQVDFPITANSVKVNPTTCQACHGTPLRPNWTAYPRWDGALGNNNGLSGDFNVDPFATTDVASHALINQLKTANTRLAAMDFSEYFTANLEYPNAYLSDKISNQMKVRDIEVLKANPQFKALKYALAGAFMECENYDDFFTAGIAEQLRNGVFANLKTVPTTSTVATSASDLNFIALFKMTSELVERNGVHLGSNYANEVFVTTWLRFLLEGTGQTSVLKNLLGNPPVRDPKDTSFTYDFVGFSERITALSKTFLDEMASVYPEDLELYPNAVTDDGSLLMGDSMSGDACTTLAKLSKVASSNLQITPVLMSANSPNSQIGFFQNYCSTCHTTGNFPLPLSDLDGLKSYRTHTGRSIADRLQAMEMPPARARQPSPEDRAKMIEELSGPN